MILQFGSFFSSLVSGIGTGISSIVKAVAPQALDIGQQFIQREVNRKLNRSSNRRAGAQAVAALNTPGIAVARLGGTIQPVGGRVQRSTFQPAALTTAQNPIGNVPLLPVGFMRGLGPGFGQMRIPPPRNGAGGNGMGQGPFNLNFEVGNGFTGPKFAQDEMGRTIMFVPSPTGSGFISVQMARQTFGNAMKPWWRFNREKSQFEKIKRRRMNPFNFRAASRAGRRIERTLDAIKNVVSIQRKMEKGVSAGGKVIKFRTKKQKRA